MIAIEEYKTIEELAKKLQCSEISLRIWCEHGVIQGAIKKGDTWFAPMPSSICIDTKDRKVSAADRKRLQEIKAMAMRKEE